MTPQKILNRDFILCFFAQFAFWLVFCLLMPTLPIYLSRFEAREAEIGFLIGIFSVSSLILRPLVGRALLRIPERNFMISGCLLYAFSSVAYLLAPPFWPLFIVRVIQGIGLALFSTAIYTLIANITPEMYRGQFISYFYLSFNMATALGPYLGMLVINHFNFVVLFWVCTGLSLCSLFIILKLGKREVIPSEPTPFKLQTILSREALPPSLMAFMLNLIWGTLAAFFPLHALKHGVTNPGIFFIFLASTLALGRILGGKILDVYERRKVVIPCLIAIFFAMVILTFSTNLPMFILVAVIYGTGLSLLFPSLLIYAIENTGSARGPAMATFTAFGDLGAGIGPMIMGIILQGTSYPIMFSCLALAGAINFLFFYYVIGKGKKKSDNR